MRHSRISITMGIYAQIVLSAQRRALLQLSAFARGGGVPATQQIAPMDLDFSEPTDEKDPRSDSRSKTFQSTEFPMIDKGRKSRQLIEKIMVELVGLELFTRVDKT